MQTPEAIAQAMLWVAWPAKPAMPAAPQRADAHRGRPSPCTRPALSTEAIARVAEVIARELQGR